MWKSTEKERNSNVEVTFIIVDNGSEEKSTQVLFDQWKKRLNNQFRILHCDEPFNWSKLNNLAASVSNSEILLFLNNDIEAHNEDWLEAMLQQVYRPNIGCVGANLVYSNGLIQHSGVIVGMYNAADHAYRGLPLDRRVHHSRSSLLSNWGAPRAPAAESQTTTPRTSAACRRALTQRWMPGRPGARPYAYMP